MATKTNTVPEAPVDFESALDTYDAAVNALPEAFRNVIVAAVAAKQQKAQLEADIVQLNADKAEVERQIDAVKKTSLAYILESRQTQDALASAKAEHARVVAETAEIQQRAADAQAMLDNLRGRVTDGDLKIAAAQVAGVVGA